MKNASDPSQVKNAKVNEKLRRDQELNDVRSVLGTIQGRRLLWKYLELCGVYKTSFTGSSETFFLEGQRNVGLKILGDIMDADPMAYVNMMKENKEIKQ
jgi:hypothetical protein